jgi:hypothetical protein
MNPKNNGILAVDLDEGLPKEPESPILNAFRIWWWFVLLGGERICAFDGNGNRLGGWSGI